MWASASWTMPWSMYGMVSSPAAVEPILPLWLSAAAGRGPSL